MAYKRISPTPVDEGGTGAQTLTDHGVLIGSGTGAITPVGPVASTGALLASNGVGSDPGFTTATYPLTTTVSEILYSSATNTVGGITAANNGTMISGATGIPSWLANGTTGQVLTATTGSPPSWGAAGGTGDVVGPAGATATAIAVYDGATGKLIANSIPTIDASGNIATSASLSGSTLSVDVINSSNTASSAARMSTTVAGGTASDPHFQASVSGGQVWTFGLDNSDSDAFAIASSAALGTTNIMYATTAGEITYPLQPAFFAYLGTADLNVTGDSTAYTLGSGNALTEVYDRNSDFVTTGTFTAPVTGIYQLGMNIQMSGLLSSHTLGYLQITTTSATYVFNVSNPWAVNYANTFTMGATVNALMTATNTATFQLIVGGGTKVVDITALIGYTYVYGHLIC